MRASFTHAYCDFLGLSRDSEDIDNATCYRCVHEAIETVFAEESPARDSANTTTWGRAVKVLCGSIPYPGKDAIRGAFQQVLEEDGDPSDEDEDMPAGVRRPSDPKDGPQASATETADRRAAQQPAGKEPYKMTLNELRQTRKEVDGASQGDEAHGTSDSSESSGSQNGADEDESAERQAFAEAAALDDGVPEEYTMGNEENRSDDERVLRALLRRVRAAWTELNYYTAELEFRLKDGSNAVEREEAREELDVHQDVAYQQGTGPSKRTGERHSTISAAERQVTQQAINAKEKGYTFAKTPEGEVEYTAHVLQVSPLCQRRFYGNEHADDAARLTIEESIMEGLDGNDFADDEQEGPLRSTPRSMRVYATKAPPVSNTYTKVDIDEDGGDDAAQRTEDFLADMIDSVSLGKGGDNVSGAVDPTAYDATLAAQLAATTGDSGEDMLMEDYFDGHVGEEAQQPANTDMLMEDGSDEETDEMSPLARPADDKAGPSERKGWEVGSSSSSRRPQGEAAERLLDGGGSSSGAAATPSAAARQLSDSSSSGSSSSDGEIEPSLDAMDGTSQLDMDTDERSDVTSGEQAVAAGKKHKISKKTKTKKKPQDKKLREAGVGQGEQKRLHVTMKKGT